MSRHPLLDDAEWCREQYETRGMTTTAIADELGCSHSTVKVALRRHDIPLRAPGRKRLDIAAGQRFVKLVVLSESLERVAGSHRCFLVRCDCGAERVCSGHHLVAGRNQSCGTCGHQHSAQTSHGHCTGGISPTYYSFASMVARCERESHDGWKYYGGRGIRICTGMRTFEGFLTVMGERPKGKTIDRVDVDGNYSCGRCDQCLSEGWAANCRWATPAEQARNTRRSARTAEPVSAAA